VGGQALMAGCILYCSDSIATGHPACTINMRQLVWDVHFKRCRESISSLPEGANMFPELMCPE